MEQVLDLHQSTKSTGPGRNNAAVLGMCHGDIDCLAKFDLDRSSAVGTDCLGLEERL